MEKARFMTEPSLKADPNDARAANDFLAVMENEAECFEDRAEGVFIEGSVDRKTDAAAAIRALTEVRHISERLLLTQPNNATWKSTLGLALIRIGLQQKYLQQPGEALKKSERGVAILKAVGRQPDAQAFDLDSVATGLTIVEPKQLRDTELALECAKRIVESSHHQKPGFLLTLAQVYQVAGQSEKARIAAREGLALLPGATVNTVTSRIRKELQAELSR
jgi:hypothetical protein